MADHWLDLQIFRVRQLQRWVLLHIFFTSWILFTHRSVQFSCSVMSTPGFLVYHQLPELAQIISIEFVMPSNHLIFCHPLLLLPSVFSSIRVFSNLPAFQRWPKFWSFSFSISPSNEYSELISFRMDWLDLLAVQGTLKGLLQHHSSKASILQRLAFSMVRLSHPYLTAGKTIALTRWTFVSKVMSLLFNMLSRFVIAFPPRSKHFLISWLQSLSAVILEPRKVKSLTVSIVSLSVYTQDSCKPLLYGAVLLWVEWDWDLEVLPALSSPYPLRHMRELRDFSTCFESNLILHYEGGIMTKPTFVDHVLFTCHDANCTICVISFTLERTRQLGSIIISIGGEM